MPHRTTWRGFKHTAILQAKSLQIVARLTGGLAFADTSGALAGLESALLQGVPVNVAPDFDHEIVHLMGGVVVGFHNLSSPSEVDCKLLASLCPMLVLCLMASLLPATSSTILSIITTATTMTTLPSSWRPLRVSADIYATPRELRARDLQVMVTGRHGGAERTTLDEHNDDNINATGQHNNCWTHAVDCFGNAVTNLPATSLTDTIQHTTTHVDAHTTMLSATDLGKALPPTTPSTLRFNAAMRAYLAACKPRDFQSTEFGVDATSGNSRPTSTDQRRDNLLHPTTDLDGWERSHNQRQRTKTGKHDAKKEGAQRAPNSTTALQHTHTTSATILPNA